MSLSQSLEAGAILERLSHRYPMLLIDRVMEVSPGSRLRAVKNVSYNEQFFSGHFPSRPLMPGVLVVEALAQAASLLALVSCEHLRQAAPALEFVGLDKARFRKPVLPGDRLVLTAEFAPGSSGAMTRFLTAAFVGEAPVATAEIVLTGLQYIDPMSRRG